MRGFDIIENHGELHLSSDPFISIYYYCTTSIHNYSDSVTEKIRQDLVTEESTLSLEQFVLMVKCSREVTAYIPIGYNAGEVTVYIRIASSFQISDRFGT